MRYTTHYIHCINIMNIMSVNLHIHALYNALYSLYAYNEYNMR